MANNRPIDQTAMPTNTNNHPPKTTPGLPAMRFEGGNVPIYLSADPREALLLHEDLLCALNRPFEAGLRRPWTKSCEVLDPATGETRKVFAYAMVASEDTFFLKQGAEYQGEDREEDGEIHYGKLFVTHPVFSKFELPESYPYTPRGGWVKTAGRDLKIMIALLYGIPLGLEGIIADTQELEPDFRPTLQLSELIADRLFDVLALAEMHECFEVVSEKISEILLSSTQLWKFVYEKPHTYAMLGKVLKCKEIFMEGLQLLMISVSWAHSSWRVAKLLDIERVEEHNLAEKYYNARDKAESNLKRELRDLALAKTDKIYYEGLWQKYLTTCSNAFSHRRRKQDKKHQRVEVLASHIWGQFTTQCFEADSSYVVYRRNGTSRPQSVGRFSDVLQKIVDADSSNEPCSLFGHKAAEGYVQLFGKQNVDLKAVKAKLADIIHKAVGLMNEWGRDRSARIGILKDGELTWAEMDTLVPLTPWEKAEQDKGRAGTASLPTSTTAAQKTKKKLPVVSMRPASDEWLGALGLLDKPEKCNDEGEEGEEEVEKEKEVSSEWEQQMLDFWQ